MLVESKCQFPRTALRGDNDYASSQHTWVCIHRLRCVSEDPRLQNHVHVVSSTVSDPQYAVRSVFQQVLQSLVVSLVLSCLDCGNATLAGVQSSQLNEL